MDSRYNIRPIQADDIIPVKTLIQTVMTEYGAVGEGYSIHDPEVDDMYTSYNSGRAAFFVVTEDEVVKGCAGIAQLQGADESVCELRKMYFYPEIRGKGLAKKIMEYCLNAAKKFNYKSIYLETVERMKEANGFYQSVGFKLLEGRLGNTGHSACNTSYAM